MLCVLVEGELVHASLLFPQLVIFAKSNSITNLLTQMLMLLMLVYCLGPDL